MFPLGIACIACCNILPIGEGAAKYADLNAQLVAFGMEPVVGALDPFKARFPIMIAMFIYCAFFAVKFCPDKPVTDVIKLDGHTAANKLLNSSLSGVKEILTLIIFFGTSILLVVGSKFGIPTWLVAVAGAALMVVCGILTAKEASAAIPIWVYLLFVGGLIMASALSNTGLGALIGDVVASVAGRGRSNILFYTMFFIAPYIMTQFILNRTAIFIFNPIVANTCLALGVNPTGALLCVTAGAMTAFMTPMATGTVSYMMGAGGYDIRTLLKMSIIPFLLSAVVYIIWISIAFPVF